MIKNMAKESPTRNRLSSASGVQIGRDSARRNQPKKRNPLSLFRGSSFVIISMLPLRAEVSSSNNYSTNHGICKPFVYQTPSIAWGRELSQATYTLKHRFVKLRKPPSVPKCPSGHCPRTQLGRSAAVSSSTSRSVRKSTTATGKFRPPSSRSCCGWSSTQPRSGAVRGCAPPQMTESAARWQSSCHFG